MNIKSLSAFQEPDGTWQIHGLPPWQVTFNAAIAMIDAKRAFKFARYGDGELNCMNGRNGFNCDHHNYYPDLGRDLLLSTMSGQQHDVITGIQPLALSQGVYTDIIKNFLLTDNHTIVNADVFHNASITGQLGVLMTALDRRNVIYVANDTFEELQGFDLRKSRWVSIHERNCWLYYQETAKQIRHLDQEGDDRVFILCASMMSEVIIHEFRNSKNTFIDLGSVLDPYCGVKSRRYHHKLKL